MKKATKRLVAAALAALVATSALTGCNKNDTDESTGPIMTLPSDTTGTGETTDTNGGTSDTSSTNQGGTVVQPTKGFNVLTGEPAVNDLSYKRPIAIVVDNNTLSYANLTAFAISVPAEIIISISQLSITLFSFATAVLSQQITTSILSQKNVTAAVGVTLTPCLKNGSPLMHTVKFTVLLQTTATVLTSNTIPSSNPTQ